MCTGAYGSRTDLREPNRAGLRLCVDRTAELKAIDAAGVVARDDRARYVVNAYAARLGSGANAC